MGTNYYAVRRRPTVDYPIHIGKASAGWMFLFAEQNDNWNDPPVVWHSFDEVDKWLKKYVVEEKQYAIITEYDEEVSYKDFLEYVQLKQKNDKDNPENFRYVKNVNWYRFNDREFR